MEDYQSLHKQIYNGECCRSPHLNYVSSQCEHYLWLYVKTMLNHIKSILVTIYVKYRLYPLAFKGLRQTCCVRSSNCITNFLKFCVRDFFGILFFYTFLYFSILFFSRNYILLYFYNIMLYTILYIIIYYYIFII